MSKNTILENYMKENNLSKTQLAKMCGVSVYLVGRVLDGKKVAVRTIFKLCVATKLKAVDLLKVYGF